MATRADSRFAKTFEFWPTPTQERIILSKAIVLLVYSSKGEGKTFSMIHRLIRIAQDMGNPIEGAIVRDTRENMITSTVKSIRDAVGPLAEFKRDYRQLIIHSDPKITAHLFGIDDDQSLTRLQGPEYNFVWLEEPAP